MSNKKEENYTLTYVYNGEEKPKTAVYWYAMWKLKQTRQTSTDTAESQENDKSVD